MSKKAGENPDRSQNDASETKREMIRKVIDELGDDDDFTTKKWFSKELLLRVPNGTKISLIQEVLDEFEDDDRIPMDNARSRAMYWKRKGEIILAETGSKDDKEEFVLSGDFSLDSMLEFEIEGEEIGKFDTDETTEKYEQNGHGKEKTMVKVVPPKEFEVPDDLPEYVEIDSELKMMKGMIMDEDRINPILLRGHKGTGKTLSIPHSVKDEPNAHVVQYDCAEDSDKLDLIGRFTIEGEEMKFRLGVIPQAIQIANETGLCVLNLEEINALSPNVQKGLNSILDWRGSVYVPGVGKRYRLKEGAKLGIVATMNPSTYGGVYELNEDLRSRFTITLNYEYPTGKYEDRIIDAYCDEEYEYKSELKQLAEETRNAKASGEIDYALSPRDEIQFIRTHKNLEKVFRSKDKAREKALEGCILGKYETEDERELIARRIMSTFGDEVR